MRWPWQKREPDPAWDEIAERMADHEATLKRAGKLVAEETGEAGRISKLMDDYERAEQHRVDRRAKP